MTNEQILKKAIEKAIKNGWEPIKVFTPDGRWFVTPNSENVEEYSHIFEIIFSHDFAKAFWGEEDICEACGDRSCQHSGKGWKCHLQQMVLEKDPIKYLEEFI